MTGKKDYAGSALCRNSPVERICTVLLLQVGIHSSEMDRYSNDDCSVESQKENGYDFFQSHPVV